MIYYKKILLSNDEKLMIKKIKETIKNNISDNNKSNENNNFD